MFDINNAKMHVDNYEILSILGNNINSSTYKVKHKKTGQIQVWKVINYERKTSSDIEDLLHNIEKRMNISHSNILKFNNIINQEENKILYIATEYCEHGSLKDVINSCFENKTRFSEELICKILYQIAFAIKTVGNYTGNLSINEVFLDKDFNIKLFNFLLHNKNEYLEETIKMCHLGIMLYEMCCIKCFFDESSYENELKQIERIFSHNLSSLIISLIKDKSELRKNIDKVLCHPTVLLKSTQWLKETCFINIETPDKYIALLKENSGHDETKLYILKLEKLRNKETSLQIREQQLNEKEYKLMVKEKKIALMERSVKEKLQQAELYLKRSKEWRSVSSESSKSTTSKQKQKKLSYENLDSTYVSCGDSVLLPTSSKLNVNKIIKPATFTRTLSERRIRFKGHSPLKEIDFNKRSAKQSKSKKGIILKDSSKCSEDTSSTNTNVCDKSKGMQHKAKQLFSTTNTYVNDGLNNCDMLCKPITWTEENKKYAFELLKLMNNEKENQCHEVKHTYL